MILRRRAEYILKEEEIYNTVYGDDDIHKLKLIVEKMNEFVVKLKAKESATARYICIFSVLERLLLFLLLHF